MTVSIRIEPPTGMAVATCTGVLKMSDAREGATALWNTAGWLGRSAVWDFRDAQFDISSNELREIAIFILGRQPATPPERIAFVTARDVDFGMARMFEAAREDPRTAFRVFRDLDEALCWARATEPDDA